MRELARNMSRFVFRVTVQLEYFLGSVSMNLETFLGFSSVLSFSPSNGDTILIFILDGSVLECMPPTPKVPS